MKKVISLLSLILCLVMAFSLVACDNGGSSSDKDDDKDDNKSTVSSENESTGSSTESSTDTTSSQPAGGNDEVAIKVSGYTLVDGNDEIIYVIYSQGETIVAMGEGYAQYPAEGATFSKEEQDDFKAGIEDAMSEINTNYVTYEIGAADTELSLLIVCKGLNTEEGMNYYLSQTELPQDVFFKGITYSQLRQTFLDNDFVEEVLQ